MPTERAVVAATAVTAFLLGACGPPPARPAPPDAGAFAPPDSAAAVLVISTSDSASWRVVAVDTLATGLEVPWGIAFGAAGRALVTERTGRIRLIDAQGHLIETPWGTVPVYALHPNINPETGLMGIVLETTADGREVVYTAVVQRRTDLVGSTGLGGRIARRLLDAVAPHRASPFVVRVLRWRQDTNGRTSSEILVDNIPANHYHAGGALLLVADTLFLGTGDGTWPDYASRDDAAPGKILRIGLRGADARLQIEASGFRNVQGLARLPDGVLLATEHGPTGMSQEQNRGGNDELNLVHRGATYGWPTVTGSQRASGVTPPVVTWPKSIAPAGLTLLPSALGDSAVTAVVSSLRGGVWMVELARDGETWVARAASRLAGLPELGRVRAVARAPDGSIWLSTSRRDGRGAPRPGDDLLIRVRVERRPGSASDSTGRAPR